MSSASSAVDHAKQLSENAQSVINNDKQQVAQASSAVNTAKQNVASASSAVTTAQNKANQAQQSVNNAQKGVDQAQANVDDDKGNLQNAQNSLDQEKDTLNGLKDKEAQQEKQANDALSQAQQAWGQGQISLDSSVKSAWDQFHNDFDASGLETTAGQSEVGRTAFANATQGQLENMNNHTMPNGQNVTLGYVPSANAEDNVKNIDINNIDANTMNRLTDYAAGLINQIRSELNMPMISVSSDSKRLAGEVVQGYDDDNWSIPDKGMQHDMGRVFAPLYDKSNDLSYVSEICSSWNVPTANFDQKVSYNDLQYDVFEGIASMLFNDQDSSEGHAEEITDANNKTNSAAIGIGFDKYGWMHIEFYQGDNNSPIHKDAQDVPALPYNDASSADQNLINTLNNVDPSLPGQIAAQQETVNDAQALVDQQQKAYDQDNATLQAINKRISDDTAKLNDLNNQLTDAQNKLADLQAGSQVTAAKQALADAQSKLNDANNALNSANQGVANAKANLNNANQAYQAAQAKLVEAQSKLASDTQAAKNAPQAIANAQKTLQQAQSALNAAQANLNKTALAYSNAQKQLQADQNKLTVAQEKLAKLTGQPMPVKPADKPANGSTSASGATTGDKPAAKPSDDTKPGQTGTSSSTTADKPAANGSQSGSSSVNTDKPATKPAGSTSANKPVTSATSTSGATTSEKPSGEQSGSTTVDKPATKPEGSTSVSGTPSDSNKQTANKPAQGSNSSANKPAFNNVKSNHTTANKTTSVKAVRHIVSSARAKEETTKEKSSVVSIATSKHEFANISNENSTSKNSLPQTGEQSTKGSILAGIASILTGFGLLGVSKKKRN